MKKTLMLLLLLSLCNTNSKAQERPAAPSPFFTRRTIIEWSITNAAYGVDTYYTDRNYHKYTHSYETNPIARPLVMQGRSGIISYFVLSSATTITASYILHRLGHHKLEHIPFYIGTVNSTWGAIYSSSH